MGLQLYRKKRDFKATPEPRGAKAAAAKGESFVVQKHAARRLHYDFRLELDGTLKSWAVTRGPSLVPGDKRLAVHVEDHPIEYGSFEGTIPKGQYGGGSVIVWDRGTWKPLGDAAKGYAKGHLEFELAGDKLKGRWHLVRMAGKPREKRENWLLIKGDDKYARQEGDADILEERPESVKTGRDIGEIEAGSDDVWTAKGGKQAGAKSAKVPAKAKKAAYPGFIQPALATLRAKTPEGEQWVHEIKFDGYRLQGHIRSGKATLLTRTGLDWTGRFGKALAKSLAGLQVDSAILDGELVVEGPSGASDFSALQDDLSAGRRDRFIYYVFDLLYLDGRDMRPASLIERKEALQGVLAAAQDPLRYSEHLEEDGELVMRHACRLSLEGVVSKLRDAPYRSGRGKDWIKSKCLERQEFVVAGYVPSSVNARAIGSLALAQHDKSKLVYAGRVGTGFSNRLAEELFSRLSKLKTSASPFASKLASKDRKGLQFVEPELVAEVEFAAWTSDGLVRHAAFRGIRDDKAAADIVKETAGKPIQSAKSRAPAIRLTHPDRLYWKDAGVTKQGLAEYYSEVWPRIAPFLVARPLSLLRCPNGVGGQCFFQKHAWKGQSPEIQKAHDPKDEDDEPIIAIDGLSGLLGLVQGGVLEIHPWGSKLDHIEQPDMIIMDLDPGDDVGWDAVVVAARAVRERFTELGLASFVKTSGGKGLHVVAPLKPKAEWPEVKDFAKALAEDMVADHGEDYVSTVSKAKRKGKILVDYLRNGRGQTAVAPYSPRARAGAPVSMPLDWEELGPQIGPTYFTIANALPRLAGLAHDPWADFWKAAKPLPGKRKKGAR